MSSLRAAVERLRDRVHGWFGQLGVDISVSLFGSGTRRVLGFVTFLMVTRTLSREQWAYFSLAYLCFDVALYSSDLGLNTGMMRALAKSIRKGEEQSREAILKTVFLVKLVTGLLAAAVGLVAAPFLATHLLNTPEVAPYVRIAMAGVLGMHLHRFYQAYFRANLEFSRHAAFILIEPVLILAVVGSVWLLGSLELTPVQTAYAFAPLLAALAMGALLPRGYLRARVDAWRQLKEVWHFSRWVYASNLLGTLRFRLNAILLANFATTAAVASYSYADKLASTLSMLTNALSTVYVPRASHLLVRSELRDMLRKTYRVMLAAVPPLLIVPLFARPLINLLQPEYVDATPVFVLLFVSILFTLVALPARSVLYSIHRPQVDTAIQATAIAVTVLAGVPLILQFGAVGAAVAMLVQRFLSATLMIGYVYLAVYRAAPEADAGSEPEPVYH